VHVGRRTRTVYELARTNIEARKCRLEVKCDGKLEIKHAHEPGLDFFT
jgi:tRNA U54 and U55 pseudouridine synthase Pus10